MAEDNQNSAKSVEDQMVQNGNGSANRGNAENMGNTTRDEAAVNRSVAAPVGLEAVLSMLAQVLDRLPVVSPTTVRQQSVNVTPVTNVAEETRVTSTPSYLKVMEHMQRLGTKFFSGGASLIEADEWMSRLQRNFDSIRCPEEFKMDIAVHHLEGNAHAWWLSISGRRANQSCSWETFCNEFQVKYFPPEALDRLEGEFMKLTQGSMNVREYESKFNNLRKYSGHNKEEEGAQIRRFRRGLRSELRKICQVRDYSTVAELVEKAAQLEGEIEEEAQMRRKRKMSMPIIQLEHGNGSRQSIELSEGSNSVCLTCGKRHSGVCKVLTGGCFRCGSLEHKARDCQGTNTRKEGVGSDTRICYNCGEVGHIRPNCPKLNESAGKQAKEGQFQPLKRQAVKPRVYTMTKVPSDPSTSRPTIDEGNVP